MNPQEHPSLGVDWHDPQTWKHLRMGWLQADPELNAALSRVDEFLDGSSQTLHRQHFAHGVTARDRELLAGAGIRLE